MLKSEQMDFLQKQKAIQTLSQREERYNYLGLLSEYQTQSELIIQKLDYTKLNPQQHFLFKRVLHGLNVYTAEELEELHWDKKRRIKKVWQRAQTEVNAWKQMICAKIANEVLIKFVPHSRSITAEILAVPVTESDPKEKNTFSFKELGINYEDVILFYMSKGLLPKNFLLLK